MSFVSFVRNLPFTIRSQWKIASSHKVHKEHRGGFSITMRRKWPFCIIALSLVLPCGNLFAQEKDRSLAFVNVHVIAMTAERVLYNHTVIVRNGQIAAIRRTKRGARVQADTIIDGGGKQYLIPGLADLHVHLRSPDELVSYLAFGVTTILHLSGAMRGAPDLLRYRAQLRQDELLGPTLFTSGPNVDGDPPIFPSVSVVVKTAVEARRVAAEQKRAGYDLIKVYNRLSPDAYTALVAAARELGLAVVGHIPRQVGLEGALQEGQAMIAHGEEYFFTYFGGASDARLQAGSVSMPDESRVPQIARATRKANVAVTPNLSFIAVTKRMLEDVEGVFQDAEAKYLHPDVLRMWQSNNPTKRPDREQFAARERVKYPFVQRLTRGLNQAGVLLLLGTDSSAAGLFPGRAAHLELRELVAAGLTPYQALATGTRNAGQFIAAQVRGADRFGTITVGGRADLVLLDRNPLENIDHTLTIAGVMARGRWLPGAELQRLRDEIAATYEGKK